MDRRHAWIAAAAACTSSAWMAMCVLGSPPASAEPPAIRLLTPDFDDQDDLDAPSPARTGRGTAAANRPLGLGFPGQAAPSPRLPARHGRTSEIRPVQATTADQPRSDENLRVELPVQDLVPEAPDSDDPPAPNEKIRSSRLPEPERIRSPDEVFDAPESLSPRETPVLMRDLPSDWAGASIFSPPYLPANHDPDALPWTDSFDERAARAPDQEEIDIGSDDLSELPSNFVPWWIVELPNPIRTQSTRLPVDVDMLVTGALQFAPQVLGIRTQPNINNSILYAENAAFDWTSFVDSKWSDLNDPVGNTLTTGNNSKRFIDQIATTQAGLRRRNEYGGEFEVMQKFGWQDNNSKFFVPAPQGTTRLQLNYTQPLLNGSGVAYNQARIVLAQIELNRSFDVVQADLQDHLVKVAEAYWDLYRSRTLYLQRRRVYDRSLYILDTLSGREEIDALQRQVNRAKAAVSSRRSEIVRAQSAIRNAESRLRLLVNDPQFLDLATTELVPIEAPRADHVPLSLAGSLQQALQYRPDISQAVHDLRSGGVRLGVSQNELLPKLNLVLSAYVAGLSGNHDILKAWGDQYSTARPGYTVGSQFEMPLGNRAAKGRLERRQWELTKVVYDFRTTVETALTEVELAVREAETSYREMLGKFQALVAAETESSYLEDRWKVLPGGDRGTTLLLEDLLEAQKREADAEGEFVQSQVAYSVALMRLRRSMGTLMIAENPTLVPTAATSSEENNKQAASRIDKPATTDKSDKSEQPKAQGIFGLMKRTTPSVRTASAPKPTGINVTPATKTETREGSTSPKESGQPSTNRTNRQIWPQR